MKYLLRVIIGLGLGGVATMIFFDVADAHVTLCMISAIAYSVGLIIPSKKWSERIASFFFSWILFYTIYTGTTILIIERFSDTGSLLGALLLKPDEAWIYHTVINFILLFLFAVKLYNPKVVFIGFWSAMITAPSMFILEQFGRKFWDFEPPSLVILYAIIGILLMLLDLVSRKSESVRKTSLFWLRPLIITTLIIFTIISLIPYAILLAN